MTTAIYNYVFALNTSTGHATGTPISAQTYCYNISNYDPGPGSYFQVVASDPLTPNSTFRLQIYQSDATLVWETNYTYLGETSTNGPVYYESAYGPANYALTDNSGVMINDDVGFSATDYNFCFLLGTHITTPTGEILVEDIKIGDIVSTVDGGTRKVLWIGRQTVSKIFSDPYRSYPVEIAAGALGENLPKRPLRLSPDHAILIGGVIAHSSALVNDDTIRIMTKDELEERFTYYHIETEDHALILAEGVAAETFVDNVTRQKFHNWKEYVELYGEEERAIYEMDYPRAHSYRQLPQHVKEMIKAPEVHFDIPKLKVG